MTQLVNADVAEINKFTKLAQLWWDENGAMGMLHTINPLRLNFITERVDVKNKKVIDIGCGGGILTESLAKKGAVVTGIDLSLHSLEIAKQHAKKSKLNIKYRVENIENLAKNNPASYDVVCCMEMLEHVPEPARTIAACAKILKPGGHVFFSTINRTLKALLFAIIGGEYILRILPKGTHTYSKLIKPIELEKWSKQNNLYLKHTTSFIYNIFLKKFKLKENIADVNYITYYRNVK
jgi:2-polyprenyl-6-hydroxyphenyl methylase / 3-demethylubiquinone-9 3-methyltransferase